MENTRLSKHFALDEFLNVGKYPDNKPTMQQVVNMTYGCHLLLEPLRHTPPLRQNRVLQVTAIPATHKRIAGIFCFRGPKIWIFARLFVPLTIVESTPA